MIHPHALPFAVCFLGWAGLLSGQTIIVTNPGFEADVIGDGAFVVIPGGPTGWSVYDPSGIINNGSNSVGVIMPEGTTNFPAGAPEGRNAALVFLGGGVNGQAGLQQTLGATLQPQTRYTLSVEIGNIASGFSMPGSTGGAGIFYDLDGFPGYRIDLLAGGTVIAMDNNGLGTSIPEGEFRTSSFIFETGLIHAQLGQNLGIRLVNLDFAGTASEPNIEVDFDNVRLTAVAVPEPGTAGLLLGAMALSGATRRRPKA